MIDAVHVLTLGLTALLVVFSVIAHELAHGYVALSQGDDTAQRAGRLTWNPLAHVDPFLTGVLPLASWLITGGALVLGGAKPVPVSPRRYRDGARSDVLVSLAGVTANAVIALACFALMHVVPLLSHVLERVALANGGLILFNLLPIAPLDGWRVWRVVRDARRRRRALGAS